MRTTNVKTIKDRLEARSLAVGMAAIAVSAAFYGAKLLGVADSTSIASDAAVVGVMLVVASLLLSPM